LLSLSQHDLFCKWCMHHLHSYSHQLLSMAQALSSYSLCSCSTLHMLDQPGELCLKLATLTTKLLLHPSVPYQWTHWTQKMTTKSLMGSSQTCWGLVLHIILVPPAAITSHIVKQLRLHVMQAIWRCALEHQGHLDSECQPSARCSDGSQLHVIPGTAVYELQSPWLRYC